jgi:hypothetical protein
LPHRELSVKSNESPIPSEREHQVTVAIEDAGCLSDESANPNLRTSQRFRHTRQWQLTALRSIELGKELS